MKKKIFLLLLGLIFTIGLNMFTDTLSIAHASESNPYVLKWKECPPGCPTNYYLVCWESCESCNCNVGAQTTCGCGV